MKSSGFKTLCFIIILAFMLSCFSGCSSNATVSNESVSSEPSSKDDEWSDSSKNETPDSSDESTNEGDESFDELTEDNSWDDIYDTGDENIIYGENGEELILDEVNINNKTPLTNAFMGNGAGVYHAYNFLNDSATTLPIEDKFVEMEVKRFKDMGVYQVRSKLDYRWVFDEKKQSWDFESEDAKSVYKWLDVMKANDIEVMFNPWGFNWIEALDYSNAEMGNPDTEYLRTDNFEENSKRWCDVTAKFYQNLYARGYNNVKYLLVFTEPLNTHADQESAQHYIDNLKRLHQTLVDYKLRNKIKVVGPNRIAGYRDRYDLHAKIHQQCDYALDIYSQHDYLSAQSIVSDTYSTYALINWGEPIEYMRGDGITKPIWIDEWNVRDMSLNTDGVGDNHIWTGVQQAVGITFAMNAGYSNAILWSLADQQWPLMFTDLTKGFNNGVMFQGLFPDIRVTVVPKMQYYAYSLLSKYCGRENGKTYLCDNYYEEAGVYVSCVETAEGEWTIIAVNANYSDVKLDFNFEKSLGGVKLYRHQYIAAEAESYPNTGAFILPANKTVHNVTTTFSDILPVGSVQVYTTIKGQINSILIL